MEMDYHFDNASEAAEELELYADTSSEKLYKLRKLIAQSLKSALETGDYSKTNAIGRWQAWFMAVAREYQREYGGNMVKAFKLFARRTAIAFEKDEKVRILAGEYGPVNMIAMQRHKTKSRRR